MRNKTAVVVQCRLSSTRLPGKALIKLDEKEVLTWVLKSMKKVPAERYFVATDVQSYDLLKPICEKNNFEIFKGDLNNVLKRFCDLVREIDVDIIVRATADNPFLMYEAAIDSLNDMKNKLNSNEKCDYLTYSGLPHGCGVEIINAHSLLLAEKNTNLAYDQEHVGPSLYNHTDLFKCDFVPAPEKYNYPLLRSTIDTYSDYLRALKIIAYLRENNLYIDDEPITTQNIIKALQSDEVLKPIIFVPSVTKGHGTGHLTRCLEAAIESKSFIYIPEGKTLNETEFLIKSYKQQKLEDWQIISKLPDETYKPVFVTDLFTTSKEDYKNLKNSSMIFSIDEGSENSENADYLLDIIPSYKLDRIANDNDISLITKPVNKKSEKVKIIRKVLVCIGGEDPSSLSENCALLIKSLLPESCVDLISNKSINLSNINVIKPVNNLREKLFEYDLIITHYGLLAFESLSAKLKVILVSTTKLHENLAKKYNFNYVPFGKLNKTTLEKAINKSDENNNIFITDENNSIGKKIKFLARGQKLYCPVCNNQENIDEVVSRNKTRTYRKCSNCKMIYISWSNVEDRKYEKSYFFNEYKNQYGKTYQEDFESIKQTGMKRIDQIKKISVKENNFLLDIGCAYGPFLSAAKDSGFHPYGTDISDDAVNYVKNDLGFNAISSVFPDFDAKKSFNIERFDVCTMWYVIEHFKNLDLVLKKINQLVKINGVFAFSTPSAQGVSGTKNKDYFYEISPTDHFSVWDYKSSEIVLKKYGFKIIKIVSTGHHPERFPFVKKHNIKKNSLIWKLINILSKQKKLGDTMEVYCKKIREV